VTSKKLTNVLKIITDSLMQEQIPYSLIRALALAVFVPSGRWVIIAGGI